MRVVIFDTETDGLFNNSLVALAKRPRIMEIFALKLEMVGNSGDGFNFVELSNINFVMDTGRPVPKEVTDITGIKTEDIKGQPELRHFANNIYSFFSDAERVVAHNLSYDMQVVDWEFERFGFAPMQWPERLCTVEATEHFKGHRLKLIDLYEHLFGERFEGAHRAEVDVRALAKCYVELAKRGDV
jgi:DNA polymerase III epsilon subunit-like protein